MCTEYHVIVDHVIKVPGDVTFRPVPVKQS